MAYYGNKHDRILSLYNNLLTGERVNVKEAAEYYEVSTKSIHRDIEEIRNFLSELCTKTGKMNEVTYNRANNTYLLNAQDKLSPQEILIISKILLDSRALNKNEFNVVFDKMIECCSPPKDLQAVKYMVSNERYHYAEPSHKKNLIDTVWDLSCAVKSCQMIEITYERLTAPKLKSRIIKPVGIMFSDFYFYLAGYIADKNTTNPTLYRVDRISTYKILNEKFQTPYANRFEEGEFRKRVQFMYGGDLLRLELKYTGESVEAVLDRFPTAKVVQKTDDYYIIKAEVFGRGIKPWILSQADKIEVLKPIELRDEIKEIIEKIRGFYD